MRIDEVLNDINVKGYVTKQLLKDWKHDPFMPITAMTPADMSPSDRKMFWRTVTKIVDHIESSELSPADAYDDYFDKISLRFDHQGSN